MYLKGETQLEQQNQIKDIIDNDVVIVRQETPDNIGFKNVTTNMATFVPHPIERKPPAGPLKQQGRGFKPPAFQGRSCYSGDYVEHPIESHETTRPPVAAWEPNNLPMTSRTTYLENFPWHSPQKPSGNKRPPERKYEQNPAPFHGQSSYKTDYIKREAERPRSARATRRNDKAEVHSPPFDGTTTYTVDYKEYPPSPQKRNHPSQWKTEPGPSPPFKGSTEYQTEYLKKMIARGARIHLEPEDKRRMS